MGFHHSVGGTLFSFADLKELLAKASPLRSGDQLAGICASTNAERVAAQMALAEVPLKHILSDAVVPYESDEVTRLIVDSHDANSFSNVSELTVGDFRNWLLDERNDAQCLSAISRGLTPEMVAAVSKIMRVQDLIMVGAKCRVVTQFRNTIGLKGKFSTRLQPNHPTDDPKGIVAAVIDGLMYGSGDAVIGVNPASDDLDSVIDILSVLDELRLRLNAP
jgi:ethanolamine ammonia-lyase large subunit